MSRKKLGQEKANREEEIFGGQHCLDLTANELLKHYESTIKQMHYNLSKLFNDTFQIPLSSQALHKS